MWAVLRKGGSNRSLLTMAYIPNLALFSGKKKGVFITAWAVLGKGGSARGLLAMAHLPNSTFFPRNKHLYSPCGPF